MTKFFNCLCLSLSILASGAFVSFGADEVVTPGVPGRAVYDAVMKSAGAYPHRLPGSEGYYKAIDDVEKILRDNGLPVYRQHYTTQVPDVIESVFKVDGDDVKIYPVAPNGLMSVTTGSQPIETEIVYMGGNNKDKTQNVSGRVVVIEWGDSESLSDLFSSGARAVIFVGNPDAMQWNVAKAFSKNLVSRPVFYVDRKEASKHGLLDESKVQKTMLSVKTVWKDVEAVNLWTVIRPTSDKVFNLSTQEAIILAARMDSFGTVPGKVKSSRHLSNAALLAESLVAISKKPVRDRAVFGVFYGSAYNAYDGLRNFYFPISRSNAPEHMKMETIKHGYEEELARTDDLINVLEKDDVITDGKETDLQVAARLLIRDVVLKHDVMVNYALSPVNIALRNNPDNAELKARKAALDAEKTRVSEMRRQVNDRKILPESKDFLNELKQEVIDSLTRSKTEIESLINWANDGSRLASIASPYTFLASYHFDFSDAASPVALSARSYEFPHSSYEFDITFYNKYFNELKKIVPSLAMQNGAMPILEDALNLSYNPILLSSRGQVYLPTAAGLAIRLPGFAFRNVPGGYDKDELPEYDSAKDLSAAAKNMDEFFDVIINEPALSMSSQVRDSALTDELYNYTYKDGTYTGTQFWYLQPDGKQLDRPASGAFFYVAPPDDDDIGAICGFSLQAFSRVNNNGYTTLPCVVIGGTKPSDTGRTDDPLRSGAVAFDENGVLSFKNILTKNYHLFPVHGGTFSVPALPLSHSSVSKVTPLNGKNDGKFLNSSAMAYVDEGIGYVYVEKEAPLKLLFGNSASFLLGTSEKELEGKGFSPDDISTMNLSRQILDDMINLNSKRLSSLHARNIFKTDIDSAHDRAQDHRDEADRAIAEGRVKDAAAHEFIGRSLASRAYTPLMSTIADLLKSVLILLILSIPFSFAMERLLIGSSDIYKQLGWNFAFFFLTFILLYFTHPAFALSQSPAIIFIAFFIIIMSTVVIYIIMNRFKSEILAMQGLDTSAHKVTSENNMVLAAILIGVSSMRNRPVKTFLTVMTVVLLTFTIISFASFDSVQGVKTIYQGDGSGSVRIEMFEPTHIFMPEKAVKNVVQVYKDKYDVFYRTSAFYFTSGSAFAPYMPYQNNIIYNPATKKTLLLEAVMGFDRNESARWDVLSKLMPADEKIKPDGVPLVWLSQMAADHVGVKPGEVFNLRSMPVRLAGTFNPSDLDACEYMDGAKIVPPNFKAAAADASTSSGDQAPDIGSFIWSAPDMIVITDNDTARKVGATVNAVVMYPKADAGVAEDASSIAEVASWMVYSFSSSGMNKHFYSTAYSASGVSDLIVPLILGALIILSSLLGSIADREREIYTFSALGLSPKDVSILFFAESGVYAVVGGLGGYLVSQLVTAILTFLSHYGIVSVPDMNYSSSSTIYTILIVMAIVMLSTIYPAVKAGNSATSDVARSWKMPSPDGNKLVFQFPFTVSSVDFGGILVFISEHFASHADSSLGGFATSNVRITHNEDGIDGYALNSELALAPFDLGVAEDFKMYSSPSDIEGIDVVTVRIDRRDGSYGAWMRGNKRFVGELRNQFLLWRSLPIETVMHYRDEAKSKISQTEE